LFIRHDHISHISVDAVSYQRLLNANLPAFAPLTTRTVNSAYFNTWPEALVFILVIHWKFMILFQVLTKSDVLDAVRMKVM